MFFGRICVLPRRNAIFLPNKFRHFQQSASPFFFYQKHFFQFGNRCFCQSFVPVDEPPLPHFAIKNQVHTSGMQTLWHELFARGPRSIYSACVRFDFFLISCHIWHKLSTIVGNCFTGRLTRPPPHHQRSIQNLRNFTGN